MFLLNATFSSALGPGLIAASAPLDEVMRSALSTEVRPASEPARADTYSHVPPAPPADRFLSELQGPVKPERKRVLIFVESFFGFGHFNIIDLLAKQLLAQGIDVAVASSTFALCGTSFNFGGAEQFDLPPLGVNSKGERCKPDQEPFTDRDTEYSNLIYRRTSEVMAEYDPHLVVYELYPFMMRWRDASTQAVNDHYLQAGRELPERVALCRDIIHSNKPTAVLNRLNTYCTRLMVRGDSHFARLEESQVEWSDIALPIHYVGNFAAEAPATAHVDYEDDVVIFCGGGFRAERDTKFLESVAAASRYTQAFQDRQFHIIISDGTPDAVVDRMMSMMGENCGILTPLGSNVFKGMLAGAAAVVTRAGYNTCFELVRMRKPFVVIPREYKEQRLRATMLERSGYGRVVREADLSAQAIAKSLDDCLNPRNGEQLNITFNGAERMAQALGALIAGERRLFGPVD